MRLHFVAISALGDPEAERELNQFLATHRVVSIERQLIDNGAASVWAICVSYTDIEDAASPKRTGHMDYRELLPEAEFAVYARLRALRKTLAERDGVPPYALFTNEQLAAMVQQRVRTAAELAGIAGVGKARIDKYGPPFLEALRGVVEGASSGSAGASDGQAQRHHPG